jgi:hypothetical protein
MTDWLVPCSAISTPGVILLKPRLVLAPSDHLGVLGCPDGAHASDHGPDHGAMHPQCHPQCSKPRDQFGPPAAIVTGLSRGSFT